MATDYEKPFRVSLKLKEGKSPHLYTKQLKEMMAADTSLHPMMEKTLKMLKKTRTPFIRLSLLREIVFDPLNMRHYDRSADPRGNWVCTLWSAEEIAQHNKDPEGHIKEVLKFFEVLGYDLYDSSVISTEYVQTLEDLTKPQIEAQMRGREGE